MYIAGAEAREKSKGTTLAYAIEGFGAGLESKRGACGTHQCLMGA